MKRPTSRRGREEYDSLRKQSKVENKELVTQAAYYRAQLQRRECDREQALRQKYSTEIDILKKQVEVERKAGTHRSTSKVATSSTSSAMPRTTQLFAWSAAMSP